MTHLVSVSQAIKKADRLARLTGLEWFVVVEDGYHVTDVMGLDTYYAGIPDSHIVYSTEIDPIAEMDEWELDVLEADGFDC